MKKMTSVELNVDTLNIMNQAGGYVELEDVTEDSMENLPIGLMHGGEHFDDVIQNERKKHQRRNPDELTPCRLLHNRVQNLHMKRPLLNKY
jgi:hypothetical protein